MYAEENNSDINSFDKSGYDFIVGQFTGAIHERMIKALIDLGVCDYLNDDKPKTVEELSKLCNISNESMFRLLRYFSFYKFINYDKSTNKYSSNSKTKYFTKNNEMYDFVKLLSSDLYYNLFNNVYSTFMEDIKNSNNSNNNNISNNNNKSNNSNNKYDIWEIIDEDNNNILFKNAMKSRSFLQVIDILNNIDFSNSNTIVDVAGSHGVLIQKIVDKYPHVNGINFDLEKVISNNPKSNNPRLQHISGSFFDSVPVADTYILKSIIHDWSDENSIKILNTISKSMMNGGKIYIYDYIYDDDDLNKSILVYDIKMYTIFKGKERSKSEWIQLLDNANLKIDKIINNTLFIVSKK